LGTSRILPGINPGVSSSAVTAVILAAKLVQEAAPIIFFRVVEVVAGPAIVVGVRLDEPIFGALRCLSIWLTMKQQNPPAGAKLVNDEVAV